MITKQFYTKAEIAEKEARVEALIYLVHQLADIQEGYILDAMEILKDVGDYRFRIKQDIDKIKHLAGKLREEVWKRNKDNISAVVLFGEESESLKNVIENFFFNLDLNEMVPACTDTNDIYTQNP